MRPTRLRRLLPAALLALAVAPAAVSAQVQDGEVRLAQTEPEVPDALGTAASRWVCDMEEGGEIAFRIDGEDCRFDGIDGRMIGQQCRLSEDPLRLVTLRPATGEIDAQGGPGDPRRGVCRKG